MTETREAFDPFEGKTVQIRNDLVLRLRGQYACGPTLPNGEPEFGWREFETPPIQHEAAAEIERPRAALKPFADAAKRFTPYPKKMEGAPVELSITLAELRQAASAYEQSQKTGE